MWFIISLFIFFYSFTSVAYKILGLVSSQWKFARERFCVGEYASWLFKPAHKRPKCEQNLEQNILNIQRGLVDDDEYKNTEFTRFSLYSLNLHLPRRCKHMLKINHSVADYSRKPVNSQNLNKYIQTNKLGITFRVYVP